MRALIVTLALITSAGGAWAQGFPVDALQSYGELRERLVVAGWQPIPDASGGEPNMPEVLCGSSDLCGAMWRAPDGWPHGSKQVVTVWRDKSGLKVAPAMSDYNPHAGYPTATVTKRCFDDAKQQWANCP